MSLFIGETPKWFAEFKWSDFWSGFKKDVAKVPTVIGKVAGEIIEGTIKPTLSGVRSAFTPTMIWLIVFIVIGLILFKNYKKILGMA